LEHVLFHAAAAKVSQRARRFSFDAFYICFFYATTAKVSQRARRFILTLRPSACFFAAIRCVKPSSVL
jgi:hypothetical protein